MAEISPGSPTTPSDAVRLGFYQSVCVDLAHVKPLREGIDRVSVNADQPPEDPRRTATKASGRNK